MWAHDKSYKYFKQLALIERDGKIIRRYNYFSTVEETCLVDDIKEWKLQPVVLDFEEKLNEKKRDLPKFIELPASVVSAKIAIEWNEVTPENLVFDSARQKLVSIEEIEPGEFRAVLETIRRLPGESPISELTPPLSETELIPYLYGDETVNISFEGISKKAKEVTGEETDPLTKAKRIYRWIARNMEPYSYEDIFSNSSDEILIKKKGDCKQYAVLFAALARASGIPTRFAFGQRYIGGDYGYHVWNQIYIGGEWLDVDASDLNFYPGALLVQLFISETFSDKALTVVLMGAKPNTALEETVFGEKPVTPFDEEAADSEQKMDFKDNFFNIAMDMPKGFHYKEYDLGTIKKVSIEDNDDPATHIGMYLVQTGYNITENSSIFEGEVGMQIITHLYELYRSIKADKILRNGTIEIAGRKGEYVSGGFRDENNQLVHFELMRVNLAHAILVLNITTPSQTYYEDASKFNKIKNSIRILSPER